MSTGSPFAPVAALRDRLQRSGFCTGLHFVDATGSTNDDLLAAAADGAAEGLVLVAEWQSAGRGRAGRSWSSPPGRGLMFSLLLRPPLPVDRLPLLSVLTAVALADGWGRLTALPLRLKWPNDVVCDTGKLAGLLLERGSDDAVVVGVGLNVTTGRAELPAPTATSVLLAGGRCTDRAALLVAAVESVGDRYRRWLAGGAAAGPLLAEYRRRSATVGRRVRAELPDGALLVGEAVDVDGTGRLVLALPDGGRAALAAGDVTHLRVG